MLSHLKVIQISHLKIQRYKRHTENNFCGKMAQKWPKKYNQRQFIFGGCWIYKSVSEFFKGHPKCHFLFPNSSFMIFHHVVRDKYQVLTGQSKKKILQTCIMWSSWSAIQRTEYFGPYHIRRYCKNPPGI